MYVRTDCISTELGVSNLDVPDDEYDGNSPDSIFGVFVCSCLELQDENNDVERHLTICIVVVLC